MYILHIVVEFILSNYFILFCAFILLFSLFQGKISSANVEKKIKKDLESEMVEHLKKDMISVSETIEELKSDLFEKVNLKEIMREYYDCVWKYRIYLLLGIGSISQFIALILEPSLDRISLNLSMLTMTISLIEYRDNKSMSKKINNEIINKTELMVSEYLDLNTIVIDEFVNKDK
ncbi:hypothetical protein [Paraclostridium sordellii]|uniref:hypothetical protein n=1 Tax=Paraclostridium sordellii TaxID=1505 RepID=UPI0022DF41BB|nr:hypothetical protein [Paeniclostridium sordellii]